MCTVQKHTQFSVSTNIACHHRHVCTVQKHTTVLRVQSHPFANLAQVPLFPAVSHFLIMDSFVAAVDEAPTTPEVQQAVVSALVDAGFTNPEHLVGTADSVIGAEAKRTRKTMASSPQSGHLVSQVPSTLAAGSLLSLLGPEASAGAVASALTAGSIVVDLNDMLEKAAVKRTQPALFQLLAAANKSAQEAVPIRKAYTYVDLTHKDVLPLWMGSEAVGGHTPSAGEALQGRPGEPQVRPQTWYSEVLCGTAAPLWR